MNSHYDHNQPGQYREPAHTPPPKKRMPLWAKLVAGICAIPVLIIGAVIALTAGSGIAQTAAGDPTPVISTRKPINDPTVSTSKPAAPPATTAAPAASKQDQFLAAARAKYPSLELMDDDTMVNVVTSACDLLDTGTWADVQDSIDTAGAAYRTELAGVIRIGVGFYCPRHNDKIGVQPGGKKPGPSYLPEDGTLLVGKDVKPGTYQTRVTESYGIASCYWARLRSLDGSRNIIDNGLGQTVGALMTLQVRSSDYAVEIRCNGATWKKVG